MSMAGGKLVTLLGFNYNKTDVRRVNTPASLVGREDALLDNRERLFIENGAPRSKGTLAFDYTRGSWNGLFKLIRSEEHTSELQSLMRISYAVFCLQKTILIITSFLFLFLVLFLFFFLFLFYFSFF